MTSACIGDLDQGFGQPTFSVRVWVFFVHSLSTHMISVPLPKGDAEKGNRLISAVKRKCALSGDV